MLGDYNTMFKRVLTVIMTSLALFCFTISAEAAVDNNRKEDNWLIYLYICGTNLEETLHKIPIDNNGQKQVISVKQGQASRNIFEMETVKLPPNVKVLINANGASAWDHETINWYGNGLYIYDSNGLRKVSNWMADMGSIDTLRDFLKFGEENYEADRRMLIFWDHGGVNGLCYDDSFTGSPEKHNLTFNDIHKALDSVYKNSSQKPFELVVFNTCVSGSYELANSIADFSKYMVGSEPSMYGYLYTDWLSAVANNSFISGAQIGKIICDSTMQNYAISDKQQGTHREDVNAFSVIDLSKMPQLRNAYEKYFKKANDFKGAFARAAEARTTEHYEDWYVDLGTLAESTKNFMPKESEDLLNAINSAVAYNCPGSILYAQGISTYYPYDFNEGPKTKNSEFENFLTQKYTPNVQKNLYKNLMKMDISSLNMLSVELDENNNVVAHLTPKQLENVSKIRCFVMPMIEDGDNSFGLEDEGLIIEISNDDLKVDWETGTVTEQFRAIYPAIDGHRVTMELSIAGRDHNIYEIPVILRGIREFKGQKFPIFRKGSLQIKQDLITDQYEIMGMGADIVNGRIRERGFDVQLGDEITPLFVAVVPKEGLDADEGNVLNYTNPETGETILFKATQGEPFKLTNNTRITYPRMRNGHYFYMFQFMAPNGSVVGSLPVLFTIDDNGITKVIITKNDIEEAAAA